MIGTAFLLMPASESWQEEGVSSRCPPRRSLPGNIATDACAFLGNLLRMAPAAPILQVMGVLTFRPVSVLLGIHGGA